MLALRSFICALVSSKQLVISSDTCCILIAVSRCFSAPLAISAMFSLLNVTIILVIITTAAATIKITIDSTITSSEAIFPIEIILALCIMKPATMIPLSILAIFISRYPIVAIIRGTAYAYVSGILLVHIITKYTIAAAADITIPHNCVPALTANIPITVINPAATATVCIMIPLLPLPVASSPTIVNAI